MTHSFRVCRQRLILLNTFSTRFQGGLEFFSRLLNKFLRFINKECQETGSGSDVNYWVGQSRWGTDTGSPGQGRVTFSSILLVSRVITLMGYCFICQHYQYVRVRIEHLKHANSVVARQTVRKLFNIKKQSACKGACV